MSNPLEEQQSDNNTADNRNPYRAPDSDVKPPPDPRPLPDAIPLARRSSRLVGAIIDFLISMLVVLPYFYFSDYFQRVTDGESVWKEDLLITAMSLAGFLVIQGYFLATRGQSIGKIVTDTRIVSVEDGALLPFWRLITYRYLPIVVMGYLPVLVYVASFVNPLMIFRADRRCLHDLIADTRVIEAHAPYRTADGSLVQGK